MTVKLEIIGGPSREDLFDCLRLADGHQRMFPVTFKLQGSDCPLVLGTIKSLEYDDRGRILGDHVDWIIRAESTHIPTEFRPKNTDTQRLFPKCKVKIVYNTKTRLGTIFITAVKGKK